MTTKPTIPTTIEVVIERANVLAVAITIPSEPEFESSAKELLSN